MILALLNLSFYDPKYNNFGDINNNFGYIKGILLLEMYPESFCSMKNALEINILVSSFCKSDAASDEGHRRLSGGWVQAGTPAQSF